MPLVCPLTHPAESSKIYVMHKKWFSRLLGVEYSQEVTQKNLISKNVLNLVLRQKCLSSPPVLNKCHVHEISQFFRVLQS